MDLVTTKAVPAIIKTQNRRHGPFHFQRDSMSFSIKAPSFLCRPDLVKGMPMLRDILAFSAETPKNRFQEKPPLFINITRFL